MKELLQEIKLLPAVIGSTVHINGREETYSDLPRVFQAKSADIGRSMERIFKLKQARDIDYIEVKFDESVMLMRPIDPEASLITICETGVNFPLVNMTSRMLLSELKTAVDSIRQGKAQAPAPEAAPPQAPGAAKGDDIDAIMHSGPLTPTLQKIKDALALAIGPISDMVMEDTVKAWIAGGPPEEARIAELIDMLCEEIDDAELEKEFREQV